MLDKKLMESALQEIDGIRSELLVARDEVKEEHLRYQSLLNLKQYLILRSQDRTQLQEKLFLMSLSSLGRSYAHVAGSVDTLYDQILSSLGYDELTAEQMAEMHHLTIEEAIELASKNSTQLFGGKVSSKLSKQSTAIMVTLPSTAIDMGGELIHSLAGRGVNVFRINTAHDSPEIWKAMADVIAKINKTRDENNRLKIFVDLAGPKIRTGQIRRLDLPIEVGSNKREKKVYIFTGDAVSTRAEALDPVTQLKEPAHICVDRYFFKKIIKEEIVLEIGSRRFRIITILGTLLILFVISFFGWLAMEHNKKKFLNDLEINLEITLENTHERLQLWVDTHKLIMQEFGKNPVLVEATREILNVSNDKNALLSSDAMVKLRAFYDEYQNSLESAGLFIIDKD